MGCRSGQFGLCATLGENTETNLVTFAWRMALSMLRDSVRGLPCQVSLACALLLVRILRRIWLRSRGVWRSQC